MKGRTSVIPLSNKAITLPQPDLARTKVWESEQRYKNKAKKHWILPTTMHKVFSPPLWGLKEKD